MEKLKHFSFLLLLLLLVQPCIYSDVTLTDEEYSQVMTALDESEKQITQLEQQVIELQLELTGVKQNLEISLEAQNLRKTLFDPLEESWNKQLKSEYWRGFKDGFFFGFLSGETGGIFIGIKVRI